MRRPALVAATITLALCAVAPPPPAAADVGGTLCSLAGWLSGVAGKVCGVAQHAGGVIDAGKKLAGGHIGGASGALTGGGATKTLARAAGLAAVATAVVAGAQYALEETGKLSSSAAAPNLRAPWFSASYWRVAAVSILLTLPFLFAAAIQAMLRSDISLLARSAFGYLPLGLLAVGIAAPLTALLLAGSDEMSAIMSSASGQGATAILGRSSLVGLVAGGTGSLFVAFFVALFTVAAAVTLWLELLIREAAVYVIVLMLPLFFAAMVWPARRIWAARAVELLVALILSKFAIVAVLSLGGAALGHTLILGFQSLFAGTALVLLAAFSPWAMLRLLPLHELAGAAVGGLRPAMAQPPSAAEDRAHPAADRSEDLAAELPARLLALMQRNPAGGGDAADGVAAAAARTVAPLTEGPEGSGGPEGPDGRGGSGGPDGPSGVRSASGWSPPDEPRQDVFGTRVRPGPLPRLLRPDTPWRDLELGPEGVRPHQPPLDDPGLGPEPDPGNEPTQGPEPDPGPALPRPTPEDDPE
ncbi:MAG: hypothetical protein ACXVRN_05760 [Solirubrobacteraceae bacterium]